MLAIGRAGDRLGPRALRRGLHNRNIPYTPVHQSRRAEILASLFIGYSWIVTHLQLSQLMLLFQSGSLLLNVCITFRCYSGVASILEWLLCILIINLFCQPASFSGRSFTPLFYEFKRARALMTRPDATLWICTYNEWHRVGSWLAK